MQEPVKPIYALSTSIYSGPHDPQKWGGKAVGLAKLGKLGLSVPSYFVFPVRKPPVDADCSRIMESWAFLNEEGTFSVRSGAPVSMPGMLATKIPVKLGDVPQAVQEVYASWDSEEARAYREKNGLEDLPGTACIVQVVPSDITYSGVAFTADPQLGPEQDFAPVIEAVRGLGEGLVQGEKAAVDLPENTKRIVSNHLEMIYNEYGHSDTEWCLSRDRVYWLQHRALKFAAREQVVPAHLKDGDVLLQGQSVGAKVARACRVDQILLVSAFTPQVYPKLLRAQAVVSRVGSMTCHAAIVAREQGYPAIISSELLGLRLLPKGTIVVVDGTDGAVRIMRTAVVLNPTKKAASYELRMPGVQLFKRTTFCVNDLCVLTYRAIEAQDQQKLALYAELLSGYLYCAVLGEIRHLYVNAHDSRVVWRSRFAELGVEVPLQKTNRESFVASLDDPPNSLVALQIVGAAHGAFKTCDWNSGYGGKPWAEIAAHLLRYLSGRLSDTLFLDGCFNLKHNSAPVFNKFSNVSMSESLLARQLNAKASSGLERMEEVFRLGIGGLSSPRPPIVVQDEMLESWLAAEAACSEDEEEEHDEEPEEDDEHEYDPDCSCDACYEFHEQQEQEQSEEQESEPEQEQEEVTPLQKSWFNYIGGSFSSSNIMFVPGENSDTETKRSGPGLPNGSGAVPEAL